MSAFEEELNKRLTDFLAATKQVYDSLLKIEQKRILEVDDIIPIRNFGLVNLIGLFESFLYTYVWTVGEYRPALLNIVNEKQYKLVVPGSYLLSTEELKRGDIILNYHKWDGDISFQNFKKTHSYMMNRTNIEVDTTIFSNVENLIQLAQVVRNIIVHANARVPEYDVNKFSLIKNLNLTDYICIANVKAEDVIKVTVQFILETQAAIDDVANEIVDATLKNI